MQDWLPAKGTPGVLGVHNSSAHTGDPGGAGSTPGLERSPGGRNDNPLQYSFLGNSVNRGAWQATVYGVAKRWTWLSTHTRYGTYGFWEDIQAKALPWWRKVLWVHMCVCVCVCVCVCACACVCVYFHSGQHICQVTGVRDDWIMMKVLHCRVTVNQAWRHKQDLDFSRVSALNLPACVRVHTGCL